MMWVSCRRGVRIAAVLVLVGCGTSADPAPSDPPRPAKIEKIGAGEVDIFVGTNRITTLRRDDLRHPRHLVALLPDHPPARWSSITVSGDGVDPTEWTDVTNGDAVLSLDGDDAVIDHAGKRVAGIDVVRVEVAKKEQTPAERLAAGCLEHKGEHIPPTPTKWKGGSHQFNIDVHWSNAVTIDLSDGPTGERIGTLYAKDRGPEGTVCLYDLYRGRIRGIRRVIPAKLREAQSGPFCAEGYYELVCDGFELEMYSYYASGEYVEHGRLLPR